MSKQRRFLTILWFFVIGSFVLFQNFTQDVSLKTVHNESCKRALELNESRILGLNSMHSHLLAVWPKNGPAVDSSMSGLSLALMDANTQMYGLCVADQSVGDSHLLALNEMNKLSDPASNRAWKRYVTVVDNTLKKFVEAQ